MFSATLPLTIPLSLIDDPETGIVAMNAMAFVFLFIIGWLWADYTESAWTLRDIHHRTATIPPLKRWANTPEEASGFRITPPCGEYGSAWHWAVWRSSWQPSR